MTRNPLKNYLNGEGSNGIGLGINTSIAYKTAGLLGNGARRGIELLLFGGGYTINPTDETGVEVKLANSDEIGNALRANGGRPGRVNLGAYVTRTDEIFVNPDSLRYGYHPLEVLGHELEHRLNPNATEEDADLAGIRYFIKNGKRYTSKFKN